MTAFPEHKKSVFFGHFFQKNFVSVKTISTFAHALTKQTRSKENTEELKIESV